MAQRADMPGGGRRWLVAACVLAAALALAWVDSRPGWDDTGITAFTVLGLAAAGALAGLPFWLSAALACGPLLAAELARGPAVLAAAPIALAGAVAGALLRRRARRRD